MTRPSKTASGRRRAGVRREDLGPGECLCDHCTARCCRYFSLPIDTPTDWDDFDNLRWYLAHGRTMVYLEEGTWYLLVEGRCQYLTPDDRCGIYDDRPRVCREYSTETCEYDSDWSFELQFETPEQLWEYAHATLPPRRKPRKPRAQSGSPSTGRGKAGKQGGTRGSPGSGDLLPILSGTLPGQEPKRGRVKRKAR